MPRRNLLDRWRVELHKLRGRSDYFPNFVLLNEQRCELSRYWKFRQFRGLRNIIDLWQ